MARIRSKETTLQEYSTVTSIEVVLPEHVTGDLLLIFIGRDNNREDFSTPSGWTQAASVGYGTTSVTGNAVRSAVYWKIASSSSETNPTFTIVNADEMIATAISIEGADAVTPIDMTPVTGSDISTPTISLPSVTTATDNALVFHFTVTDGNTVIHPPADWISVELANCNAIIGSTIIATVQQTAGAVAAAEMYSSAGNTDESAIISLAIRDGSSGAKVMHYPLRGCVNIIDPLRSSGSAAPANQFSTATEDFTNLWKFGQSPTLYDPTSCWQVTAVGPVFVSMLTQATNDTQGDVVPFPASEAIGDYFVVGYSSPWSGMLVDRTGATLGTFGTVQYEYWNGSSWSALTEYIDGTASPGITSFCKLAIAGGQYMRWKIPSNWATLSLNGETADYKVRWRVITLYTVNPTLTRLRVFTDSNARFAMQAQTGQVVTSVGLNYLENAVAVYNRINISTSRQFFVNLYDPQVTQDWSSGLVAFCYGVGGGTNLKSLNTKAIGGAQFGIHDRTNDRIVTWCIGSTDSDVTSATDLQTVVVQPSQSTDTSWRKSGTPPSISNVDSYFFGFMQYLTAGRTSFLTRFIHIPSTIQVCGGGSGYPITWAELIKTLYFYEFPILNKTSSVCIAPLQFGGTKKVYLDMSIFALQFPPQANATNAYTKCHVDDGYLGVVIDARAGDVVKMTSGFIVGNSKIRFEMLATCSASATYSFNGLTVVNANVTMRPVKTFSAMQFINCTTFAQNETVFDGCSFKGSTITCDKVEGFSNCTFTCSAEHALVLGASEIGTHNFFGNTFSGYGADGSSTAAIYNNSGGLVTLQLSVGDSTPTVKNGAGASTVILAPQATASVTNVTAGSRIQVYNTTTATEIANEVVAGTSWSLSYNNGEQFTAGDEVRLRLVYVDGLNAKRAWSGIAVATSTGFTVIAMQVDDAIYEQFGIDGSTVTEFTFDTPNLQIDIDDPDNVWYASRLYAYMMYYQMSSAGIANAFDTVYGTDNGNIRLNGAYLDNLSSNTAKQGDAIRIYRDDDNLPVINPTTGGGGLTFFSTGTIYIAETGTSGLTPDESAKLDSIDEVLALAKLIPATV